MRNIPSALESALKKKTGNIHADPMQTPANPARQGMPQPQPDVPEGFYDVVEELTQLIQEGDIPADFDLEQACTDPAFAELIAKYPPDAAIRIYVAENKAANAEQSAMRQVNAQVQSRRALPRSARGGAMTAPKQNYRDMDDASFRKLLMQIKRSTRNGESITL